jgi:hypothetical protein
LSKRVLLIREAGNLSCQSWNERMWSDGGPIDPSPTTDQAINGGLLTGRRDDPAVRSPVLQEIRIDLHFRRRHFTHEYRHERV